LKKKGKRRLNVSLFSISAEKVAADLEFLVAVIGGVLFRDLVSMVLRFGANGRSQDRPVLAVRHVSDDCPCHCTFHHTVVLDGSSLLSCGHAKRSKEKSGGKKSCPYVGSCD
jgi:hypothetical protein